MSTISSNSAPALTLYSCTFAPIRVGKVFEPEGITIFVCLFAAIINLHPVSIRVFEVDLFNAVHSCGDGSGFSGPVLVGDFIFLEGFDEFVY